MLEEKSYTLLSMKLESKIRRRVMMTMKPPDFMSYPRDILALPEGRLIVDGRNWLDDLSRHLGSYSISKERLGKNNSRTTMYVLKHGSDEYKIAVKDCKIKSTKVGNGRSGNPPVKRFRLDPLFRLGSEYKAIRYLRSLGLHTPLIEAVVLDRRLLVTQFLDGITLADVIRDCMRGKGGASLISKAGAELQKSTAPGQPSAISNLKISLPAKSTFTLPTSSSLSLMPAIQHGMWRSLLAGA